MCEKKILNTLLDKYENSKSFIGDNKVNQQFSVIVTKIFPKYEDDSEYHAFVKINEAIEKLSALSLIDSKKLNNGVYFKVTLNMDNIFKTYDFVRRIPKADANQEIEIILKSYAGNRNEILSSYAKEQIKRLRINKKVKYHDGDTGALKDLLHAVEIAYENQNEIYIRDFSIRHFKDSKKFESIVEKFKNLVFEFGDYPEKETVLDELNIVKTPTYVSVKGAARIWIGDQSIDLSVMKGDIAFSSNTLNEITKIEISGSKVITVENLTSFHTFEDKTAFVIYLGGFHNTIRRKFIKLIYKDNPDKQYQHFGDIDAGGFLIYEHLKEKTGVPFERYSMDKATLEQYEDYWKALTANDKKRLVVLKGKGYDEVIDFMIKNNCKLEQEVVKNNLLFIRI
jgi:hypothetical protein